MIQRWDDLVFENRNKGYGAYLLRRAYRSRVLSGMGVTIAVIACFVLWSQLIPDVRHDGNPETIMRGAIDLIYLPPQVLPKPPKPKKSTTIAASTKRRAKNIVVTKETVVESEPDVTESVIEAPEGEREGDALPSPEGIGTIALPDAYPVIEKSFVEIAEVMPSYQGGMDAMMRYIQKKIRYPRAPRDMGIDGTVYVRFVVRGDGSVTDVEVIRGIHPDCDQEAMRVISSMPAWNGGSHNGKPVAVRMVLPIRFNLQR